MTRPTMNRPGMTRSAMKFLLRLSLLLLLGCAAVSPASAHVGNKDVYEQVEIGGYKLFVTIRTPMVIPGVAIIEVRSLGAPVTSLGITPLLLTGEASKHPPTPDAMKQSKADPQFFTGSLWLMGSGSWQVRFLISGANGPQTASVPVPAAPTALLKMQRPLGLTLGVLGIILVLGMAGIVAAAVRESRLQPGIPPDATRRRRAAIATGITLAVLVFAVFFGGQWWNAEAADYASHIYRASDLHLALAGNVLTLQIGDPDRTYPGGWKPTKNENLLLDHGRIMHLYAIRWPQMDAAFHLHPDPTGAKGMTDTLPSMLPGTYKLFGDIVYRNGFAETVTSTLDIPSTMPAAPLAPHHPRAPPPPPNPPPPPPHIKQPPPENKNV